MASDRPLITIGRRSNVKAQNMDPLPRDAAAGERLSTRWVFLLGLLGAVVLGAAISAQTYLSMLGHGHAFGAILTWQLSSWSVWAIVSPLVVREAGALAAVRTRSRRTWGRLCLLGIACIALHAALAAQMALWFQPYVPVVAASYGDAVLRQLSVLPVDALVYAMLVLIGWAVAVSRSARRLEVRESRLEAELAKAQLESLRLEIQPHFLFNTLNAIAALIRLRSNDRALEMLVGLSELMRGTLERSTEQLSTLDAEVDFTRRYVDLQLARFADRLTVDYRIDARAQGLSVPTFVLQPLVENAIRHGMGRHAKSCHIEIGAIVEHDVLRLWVGDDGIGLTPGFDLGRDARTGLGNTRSRLERLYGRAAHLRLTNGPMVGTMASITIPVNATAPAAAIA